MIGQAAVIRTMTAGSDVVRAQAAWVSFVFVSYVSGASEVEWRSGVGIWSGWVVECLKRYADNVNRCKTRIILARELFVGIGTIDGTGLTAMNASNDDWSRA